ASRKSAASDALKALRASARRMVTVATLSSWLRSTLIWVYLVMKPPRRLLHSKNAEWGVGCGCVQGCGDAQREYGACVAWVDDAVVPQASAAVIGVAFGFVFIENGLFEGSLFFFA